MTGRLLEQRAQRDGDAKVLEIVSPVRHIDPDTVAGEKVTVAFEIKNIGTEDVNIIRIQPHCACTEFEISKLFCPDEGTDSR